MAHQKKAPSYGGQSLLSKGGTCDIFKGSAKKMNGLYTTKPFRVSPHLLFCQRLLGVRPTNMKTSETELTLSMMRPAGREQIKRIDVKIRYSNHSSSLLTKTICWSFAPALKGKCG